MESQEFIVLYTHQKTKKSKVWHDGILKLSHLGNQAVLYDDKGGCLESLFLKHPQVKPGDDLESDRYLITVEEVRAAGSTTVNQDVGREAAEFRPRQPVSSGRALGCQPAGLKRRFAGFQGPRQVPKIRAVMEGGGSVVSREAVDPGPSFLSALSSTPLLFPAAGRREANGVPTNPENTVVCKDRGGQGWPLSTGSPALSSGSRPDGLWEEHLLCSPVSPTHRLAPSILTREPVHRERAASLCFQVTETVRSKAQILALLKSKPASASWHANAEMAGHCPQVQPRGSVNIPTEQKECIEGTAEGGRCQQPAENTVRRGSRWAVYLSSQSSPVHSPVDGNDQERAAKAQGEDVNLNLRDLLVQKRIQFFETGAENGKVYNKDRPVADTTPSWDQDIKLVVPSFCESQRLPVTCGVENDGQGSEPDIPENTKIAVNHNDQMCMNRSILTSEDVQEINSCGTPEQTVSNLQGSECPQIDSSPRNNSGVSDVVTDMFSRGDADSRSLSFHESVRNVVPPVLEVNFNLNNFEASDAEEESQEGDRMSQDPEGGEKETLADDCRPGAEDRCEGVHCGGGDSPPLPPLPPAGAEPVETFPTHEAPPSQLCGERCVGFDSGPWKAGPMGDETEACGGSALEWTDDVDAGNGDVTAPIQKVRSNYDFASVLNKSKGTNSNLHIPYCLNVDTNQTPESKLFSKQTQHQPFIRESDLDRNDGQVLRSASGSVQLLNASPNHHEECIALDKSNPQVASSLFHPLGRKHAIFKNTEAHVPESEDWGGILSLPHDQIEVDTAGEDGQTWNSPRSSSESSEFVNSISLLKSLSEYSTALEGLEILKKKNTTGRQPTCEPESSPEAGKPSVTVVPQAGPKSPCLNQGSQQCSTPVVEGENEAEPRAPLRSLQFLLSGREEDTAFPAVAPVQTQRRPWGPQGYQVQGSATSAVMVRGHSSQVDSGQCPGHLVHGGPTADPRSWAAEPSHAGVQAGFFQSPGEECFPKAGDSFDIDDSFQVMAESHKDSVESDSILDFPHEDSECSYHYLDYHFKSAGSTSWEAHKVTSSEQTVSAVSHVFVFSLDSRVEDSVAEFSEEPLRASAEPVVEKPRSLEGRSLQGLPLASKTQVPLITVPPAARPPGVDTGSGTMACYRPAFSASLLDLCGESVALGSGPEDQGEASLCQASREVTPGGVSPFHHVPAQSKWLKYQSAQCDQKAAGRANPSGTDGPGCGDTVGGRPLDSTLLGVVGAELCQQGLAQQDGVCGRKALPWGLKLTSETEGFARSSPQGTGSQEMIVSELCFPSGQKVKSACLPQRLTRVPAVFQSPAHYKQVFTSCLIEHLNILLFGSAQRLHKALSAVDISFYTSAEGEKLKTTANSVPFCHHHQPAKLVVVKKEGPNKGRLFYTCDAPKADQCKFFKWLEEVTAGHLTQEDSTPAVVLRDIKSIGVYLRSHKIPLYEECQLLVRKGFDFQRKQYGRLKKFTAINPEFYSEPKSKLYLKLSRKESSSTYSKDDLWVVSKTLDFELDTFIACSAFFGPSSVSEVELLPVKGYFPSSWSTNTVVHALLVCNAGAELSSLRNLRDHVSPASLPLTPHLLATFSSTTVSSKRVDKRRFIPPAFSHTSTKCDLPSLAEALLLATELIQAHRLNEDQAAALTRIAQMVAPHGRAEEVVPITIVHGVFGAGKSYLLAVVILFLVQLFEKSEAPTAGKARPWKLLVSSSTNVAVDRVLLGLLSLGFEKFVRVGSVRKIAKPVLPYSLHAGSENANEQLKELHALMKEDLTPTERVCVRKSIEQHTLGTNKALLRQVRVVGVTCAACPFPCMDGLQFPVVVLDESSQMTEPTSLLPIARFECEKLILVGDPKQLPPTIQGSDAAHENGLEQTLFDRLCLMGHKPVLLRTQYRCHPAISAIANDLFYGGGLRNGVSETDRSPLLDWLPTLCFYNVQGQEQMEGGNSFHNVAEATFVLTLVQSLVACGIAGSAVGVVTLYKSQMCQLYHLLRAVDSDHPTLRAVQVSTVDAFQGAEKEVIILSCVRTRQVGFIDSEKRMNVALTRGRRHLLIVGNLACLRKNRLWGRVIQHCEGRDSGLQHASQCEPWLHHLLKGFREKRAEETQQKRSREDPPQDERRSQTGLVPPRP